MGWVRNNDQQFQVTGYLPSHKQHSLNQRITPKEMRAKLAEHGIQPKRFDPENNYDEGGEKVSYEWQFFVQEGYGAETTLACEIWDFKGSRWSAYGPREVFAALGLL